MVVYHGTTQNRAKRICSEGFLPRKPSRHVWFAESYAYALGRARTQAKRAKDYPVVLTCELNPQRMRAIFGRRYSHRNGIIAIAHSIPVNVLRSYPASVDQPSSPREIATWINEVLGLKRYNGVGWRHPGVLRLAEWVTRRFTTRPTTRIGVREFLGQARRYVPGLFEGVDVDPDSLRVRREHHRLDLELLPAPSPDYARKEDKALEDLESPKAERRARGLRRLARIGEPDLFEWCTMFLGDEAREVRIAALRAMLDCETAETNVVMPLVEDDDKRVRAAAIAVVGKHADDDRSKWIEFGLRDPAPCVRIAAASVLEAVEPAENRSVFELALYDANPAVRRAARKVAAGKGFSLDWPT